jgi:hypothetical protein
VYAWGLYGEIMEKIAFKIEKIDNGYLLHFESHNATHDAGKKKPVFFSTREEAIAKIVETLQSPAN